MTVAVVQLQDKLDGYGSIRSASMTTSVSPAKPPLADRPPTGASPFNTTPKRKLLRKSSSVEFAAHHLEDEKSGEQRREPRRLSLREKQELYKVRPDLEIGAPHSMQVMLDEQNDQRRRVACSLFVGVGCVVLLVLFYYFIAWNMRDDPDFQ
ncbi:Aste57867_24799 [Aphanomyces stellatus]|uniref:Aste57867_24799 protein n=1 Tax=Aphanomyces stellatus TaxID=120398 RepID=A0A485LSD1_9STRA|nr:hypothetical protein As57867_024721 [Aphanomyces stellatus]VFU01434.1 Aste57867_24799 [Aphanomyces stellatus]